MRQKILRIRCSVVCLPEEKASVYTEAFFGLLEEVTFDGIGQFGFEEFFPNQVQLAGDGFGNFWILDINKNGNWGNVFYVCHSPAVIIKHSDNLTQFIEHVNEFGKNGKKSNLDIIHEEVVFKEVK